MNARFCWRYGPSFFPFSSGKPLPTTDMGNVTQEGQQVSDHRVLHLAGVQHFQAFCLIRNSTGGLARMFNRAVLTDCDCACVRMQRNTRFLDFTKDIFVV